jgi:hypothetical protein
MTFIFSASDDRLDRSNRIVVAGLVWHRASDIVGRHKRLAEIDDDFDEGIKHRLAPWRLATSKA